MARSTFSLFLALALFAGVPSAFSQGTGGIVGRITRAATGAPMPGIQVQILDGSSGNATGATSGPDGLFVVSGLAPGYYYARTSNGQGFVDELYHEVPCPGSCTVLAGTPILVTANAMTGNVDFTLQAEARLAGTITDAVSRTPLAGVRVSLLSLAGSQLASGATAPDGSYSIGVPYEGPCLVKADGTGGGYVSELFDNVMCQPECDLSRGNAAVAAFDTVTAGLDFALVPGGSITGRIVDAVTTLPIVGATVQVRDGSGATRAHTMSDGEGRYRALGLASGTYRVRAAATEHLGEAFDDVMCPRLDCASTTGTGVSVTVGATTPGIDFSLTRGGRIEGTVTGGAATSPLAGINVEVLTVGGSTLGSVPTDDAGRYSVRGLAGGSYFVRTRNFAGFMDELYDDTPCPGGSCLVASGKSIVVTPAATTSSVDFDLMPGGRVTGIVTAQDTGLPLDNVHVTIHDAEGRFVGSVSTDTAGTYAFGGLAATTYFVQARSVAHGYIGELFDDRPCPGQQCAATSGTPVVVTLATTTGGVNFALARGGRIAGVVTDALSGAPVPNVTVEVRTASQHLGSVSANESGQYLLTGLEPGAYYVRAYGDGHLGEVYDNVACIEWPCALTAATMVSVALASTTGGVDFALQPGGAISGRIVDVAGGAPIAGISVAAIDSVGNWRRTATTSQGGDYGLRGLLPGTYTIRVDTGTTGYLAQMYANVPCHFGSCSGPGTSVVVAAATTTAGIDFALQSGGRITGTITDASTGAPVRYVSVIAHTQSGNDLQTSTTVAGTYQFTGLPTGSYYVRTSAWGNYVNQLHRGVDCRETCLLIAGTPVAVTAGTLQAAVDFRLVATGSIAGRVTDSASSRAVQSAQVEVLDEGGTRVDSTSTDAAGGFALGRLAPGLYYLRVRGPEGYASELYDSVPCPDLSCFWLSGTPIVVSSATTRRVDVSLDPVGSIGGRVTAAGSGVPLPNVWVFAYDATLHAAGAAFTDALGRYVIDDLAIGSYRLSTATLSAYMDEVFDDVRCAAECDLRAGRAVSVRPLAVTGTIDFALDSGGRISGVATDGGTGRLLANVTVDVLDQAGASHARTSTTAQGTYLTPGLPAGSYYVRAMPDGGFVPRMFQEKNCAGGACTLAGSRPVAVTAQQTTAGIDFPLQCAVSISPAVPTLPAAGGTVSMTVTAVSPDCRWRALPDPAAAWVTVDDTQHVGSGAFEIAAASNAGASRIATLLVAGLPLQVTQARGGPISYYLAEGATGSDLDFDLDIVIANPNPVDAPISIRFLTPAGVAVARDLTLGALRRTTIRVNEIAGLESTAVSTEVTSVSGAPLVVERTMFWGQDGYGGHGGTAVDGASTRWYFAEGFQGFFDTYVLVANPGDTAARCVVTFLLEREPPVTVDMAVGAGERASLWAGSVPALAAKAFGILVEADQPVVAERAMYFGAGRTWDGGHESAGVTAPATEWFLAEGATGDYFDTYVLVGNPNDDAVDVVFSFLLPDGRTVHASRSIAGRARLTVPVEREHPALASTAFSTRVAASGPVIVERAVYWPGDASRWAEAHNSFGVTEPGTRWGLAEGRVGGVQAFETYILVANPSSETADVRVTFLFPDRGPTHRTYTVPPTSRFNIQLDARTAPPDVGPHFGAIVESLNGVPIVVERAMYWNAGAEVWAGGTNAVAVRLPQ